MLLVGACNQRWLGKAQQIPRKTRITRNDPENLIRVSFVFIVYFTVEKSTSENSGKEMYYWRRGNAKTSESQSDHRSKPFATLSVIRGSIVRMIVNERVNREWPRIFESPAK
jgi:hypothetical protein